MVRFVITTKGLAGYKVGGGSATTGGSSLVRGRNEGTRHAEGDGLGTRIGGGVSGEVERIRREEVEAGLGRGRYEVGAEWEEGNIVHAMRRFGGRTIEWRFGVGPYALF